MTKGSQSSPITNPKHTKEKPVLNIKAKQQQKDSRTSLVVQQQNTHILLKHTRNSLQDRSRDVTEQDIANLIRLKPYQVAFLSTTFKSSQSLSHVRLCNPMDCSPRGSCIRGILQARILEWVAISFSRGSSRPRDRTRSPTLQADALPSKPPGSTTL